MFSRPLDVETLLRRRVASFKAMNGRWGRSIRVAPIRSVGRSAFTLMELLVVTAILGVVITVIGGALAGGLRVWRTSREYNSFEMGTRVELAILERDVMNTFDFYAKPLAGTRTKVSMPGTVRISDGELYIDKAATIEYLIGGDGTTLLRKAWVFPKDEPPDSKAEAMIKDVHAMDIEYLSGEAPNGAWLSEWSNPTNLPGGIRFRLVFPAEGNGTKTIERTFILPGRRLLEGSGK